MKYKNSRGKEIRVSDKRYKEFCNKKWNTPEWLDFRCKHFPQYCREELIMNPKPYMILIGKDNEHYEIWFWEKGCYYFGEYGTGGKITDRMRFDTPDEAYKYFEENIGHKYPVKN